MSAPIPLNSGCCAPPCPSNPQTAVPGPAGENAFSFTTAPFTQPVVGASVVVPVTHSGWVSVGQIVYVQGGGYYGVSAVSGLSLTLVNTGYSGNAIPGTVVSASAQASPGGVGGVIGNAYTAITANFIQPNVGGIVNIAVLTSSWAAIGQPIFISTGGAYRVFALPDPTHMVVTNLGYPTNAAVGTLIISPQQVSPSGERGPAGALGIS